MAEVWELSARELVDGYRSRAFSPVEAFEAVAARIEAVEPAVRALERGAGLGRHPTGARTMIAPPAGACVNW